MPKEVVERREHYRMISLRLLRERRVSRRARKKGRVRDSPSQDNVVHRGHDHSYEVGVDRGGVIGVCRKRARSARRSLGRRVKGRAAHKSLYSATDSAV